MNHTCHWYDFRTCLSSVCQNTQHMKGFAIMRYVQLTFTVALTNKMLLCTICYMQTSRAKLQRGLLDQELIC